MTYDEVNQTITFEDLDGSKVGLYSVMITLMDAKGEYNEYELEFQLLEAFTWLLI